MAASHHTPLQLFRAFHLRPLVEYVREFLEAKPNSEERLVHRLDGYELREEEKKEFEKKYYLPLRDKGKETSSREYMVLAYFEKFVSNPAEHTEPVFSYKRFLGQAQKGAHPSSVALTQGYIDEYEEIIRDAHTDAFIAQELEEHEDPIATLYDQAYREFQRAAAIHPVDSRALYYLGEIARIRKSGELELYLKASEVGNSSAILAISEGYEENRWRLDKYHDMKSYSSAAGLTQRISDTLEYVLAQYSQAAREGNPDALFRFGAICKDEKTGYDCMREAVLYGAIPTPIHRLLFFQFAWPNRPFPLKRSDEKMLANNPVRIYYVATARPHDRGSAELLARLAIENRMACQELLNNDRHPRLLRILSSLLKQLGYNATPTGTPPLQATTIINLLSPQLRARLSEFCEYGMSSTRPSKTVTRIPIPDLKGADTQPDIAALPPAQSMPKGAFSLMDPSESMAIRHRATTFETAQPDPDDVRQKNSAKKASAAVVTDKTDNANAAPLASGSSVRFGVFSVTTPAKQVAPVVPQEQRKVSPAADNVTPAKQGPRPKGNHTTDN